MKYAPQVIEMLSAHPGRQFVMQQIVQYVRQEMRLASSSETIGRGIRRVMAALHAAGRVDIHTGPRAVERASYSWRKSSSDTKSFQSDMK